MKRTLTIDDTVMTRLRAEATREGRTMSELVESGLRLLLDRKQETPELPVLPQFSAGGTRVDVSNRDELYEAMGGR